MYDTKVFQKFLSEAGKKREVRDKLDKLLCSFYITHSVWKKDRTEYEPDTISLFSRSIQLYLDSKNSKIYVLKDEELRVQRSFEVCIKTLLAISQLMVKRILKVLTAMLSHLIVTEDIFDIYYSMIINDF